jgi:hypothetical protein
LFHAGAEPFDFHSELEGDLKRGFHADIP